MEWELDKPIKVGIPADVLGCLAVHARLNGSGDTTITHIGSGFSLGKLYLNDVDEAKRTAAAILEEIPNLDDQLTAVYAGTKNPALAKKIEQIVLRVRKEISPKRTDLEKK